MPNESDTIWLQQKLNIHARTQAEAAIQSTGRALPCSVVSVNGALVKVNFEAQIPCRTITGDTTFVSLPQLILPKAESQWCRIPTQVGDFGITVPADTLLGAVSGQTGAAPDLSVDYGNLSSLVFVPVASVNFSNPPDANAFWGNGPNGARIGDNANEAYVDANPTTGVVTIKAGGKTWTFSSAGFTMDTGVVAETHQHGGVTTGSGTSGGPIP